MKTPETDSLKESLHYEYTFCPPERLYAMSNEHYEQMVEHARRLETQRDRAISLLKWAMDAGRITYSQRTNFNQNWCDKIDEARAFLSELDKEQK